jgi:hypothetical protein
MLIGKMNNQINLQLSNISSWVMKSKLIKNFEITAGKICKFAALVYASFAGYIVAQKILIFRNLSREFAALIAAVFSGHITTSISGTFPGRDYHEIDFHRSIAANFAASIVASLQHLLPRVCSKFATINLLFFCDFTME